jgi:simple sugar transport system ATP-binding protein
MTPVLEVRGITKRFPGVLANNQVHFDLQHGEIHALLGENGAGKTTLMNVLYGLYRPEEGEILRDGKTVVMQSPKDAIALGIGMVHQHFMLTPVFTVTENIMLGSETVRKTLLDRILNIILDIVIIVMAVLSGVLMILFRFLPVYAVIFAAAGLLGKAVLWVLDRQKVAEKIRALSHRYGLDVNPEALVRDLPVGVQQRVEIVKTLYRDARILILDEPTAVLTPQEADDLFQVMNELKSQGVSIIFITHKLREVLAVADRITVMRAGRVVGTVDPKETNEPHLAAMMVGREVILKVDKEPAKPGKAVLQVSGLQVRDLRGVDVVQGVSFEVHAGEVLGVAGVQGNGQTELVEALTGLCPTHGGKVFLQGVDVTGKPPRPIIENGLAHIPEDRQRHGLVLSYPIADNLVLCTYYLPPFANGFVIQNKPVDENARKLVKRFDVRTPSPYVHTSTLSGGNQQKVIVARELSRPVALLIANQPTRGLDVGSIEYIHRQIIDMRDQGVAVLLVSAELDEILSLADRIAVMYKGQIVAVVDAETATKAELGLLMAGASPSPETSRPAAPEPAD